MFSIQLSHVNSIISNLAREVAVKYWIEFQFLSQLFHI